ncbi:MAG: hypothetical protein ACQESP_01330 [Candidatus Muiribacteriota bacterium]
MKYKIKALIICICEPFTVFRSSYISKNIKNSLTNTQIDYIVDERYKCIVENWSFTNRTISVKSSAGIFHIWALIKQIKKQKYDYVFHVKGKFPAILFKIGLNYEDFNYLGFYDKWEKHLNKAGISTCNTPYNFNFPDGFKYRIGKIKPPLLTLIPFSEYPKNDWGLESFLYLASVFNKKTGGSVAVVSPVNHNKKFQAFNVYNFVFNLCNKADIMQSAFVIKHSSAVVASPSWYINIASCVNSNIISVSNSDKKHIFTPDEVQNLSNPTENEVLSKILGSGLRNSQIK